MTSAAKISLVTAIIALASVACDEEATLSQGFLQGPAGLVLAGPAEAPLLFIANAGEDALQVATLPGQLEDFDFVRGAVRFFPLRIQVGKAPSDLAATRDGSYVLALSRADRRVDLVNADINALTVAKDVNGNPITFDLGENSTPSALIAAPEARECLEPCLGRFYVTLTGQGAIAELEVTNEPTVVLVATYAVGGTPTSIAADPNGAILYIGDSTPTAPGTFQVVRFDVTTNAALDPLAMTEAPGPVAITTDGTALAVARAEARDVLIFRDPAGLATPIDANAPFAPKAACLPTCGATADVCETTSPFDQALCGLADSTGIAPGAEPEPGSIYIGTVASRILPLPGGPLEARCDDTATSNTAETVSYDQSFAVAGVEGLVRFIGVHQVDAADLTPTLVTDDLCAVPSVAAEILDDDSSRGGIADPELTEYLGACPSAPDRARFYCTGTPGVVVLPGQLAPGSADSVVFRFDWEGVVATSNTGRFVGPNTLFDGNTTLPDADIQVGDLLVLRTAPGGEACQATELCEVERVITGVTRNADGETTLTVAEGFDFTQCYPELTVRYDVRVANQYLVDGGSASRARMGVGQTFGPGGALGETSGALFALAPATSAETGADLARCDRYEDVRVGDRVIYRSTLDAVSQRRFSRNRPFAMRVTDPLDVAVAGLDVEIDVSPSPPLGRLPGSMLLVDLPGDGPQVLFMTYTGTNGLLGFQPFDVQSYDDPSTYDIID